MFWEISIKIQMVHSGGIRLPGDQFTDTNEELIVKKKPTTTKLDENLRSNGDSFVCII